MNDVLSDLYTEAHERDSDPRRIAAYVVCELESLGGDQWVEALLAEWTVTGAMKACADWRRRQEKQQVTVRSGKQVDVPAWGSARNRDEEGVVAYEQLRFSEFTREQLDDWIKRQEATRDTLSSEIAAAKVLLAHMDAHPECSTVGEAIDALGLAA